MWPIGRKRVIEMQSCCSGCVRGIAHFCSDMTTLGSDFPLKQGNLGNVISSVGLQAKRRTFLFGTVLPCGQCALGVLLAPCVQGNTFLSLTSREAVNNWALRCSLNWLLRI